jgi:hypothetical protein
MSETNKEQIGARFKTITNDIKLYVEKRIELLLLNVGEQYSKWIAQSIQKATGLFLLFGAVVFLLIALAIYLGEVTGNPSLGYVIVSIPFFVLGLLFYYLKPKSLVETLQRHFESELVDALNQNGEEQREVLKLPEESKEESI